MAEKLIYTAELRDIFIGTMGKYQVEIFIKDSKIESVYLVSPEGDRERCSIIESLGPKK